MARYSRRNRRRAKLERKGRAARAMFQADPSLSPAQKALIYGARGAAALATGGASELARAGVQSSPRARRRAAAIATGGASELVGRGRGGRIARGIATGGASELARKVRKNKTPWWKRRRR